MGTLKLKCTKSEVVNIMCKIRTEREREDYSQRNATCKEIKLSLIFMFLFNDMKVID